MTKRSVRTPPMGARSMTASGVVDLPLFDEDDRADLTPPPQDPDELVRRLWVLRGLPNQISELLERIVRCETDLEHTRNNAPGVVAAAEVARELAEARHTVDSRHDNLAVRVFGDDGKGGVAADARRGNRILAILLATAIGGIGAVGYLLLNVGTAGGVAATERSSLRVDLERERNDRQNDAMQLRIELTKIYELLTPRKGP